MRRLGSLTERERPAQLHLRFGEESRSRWLRESCAQCFAAVSGSDALSRHRGAAPMLASSTADLERREPQSTSGGDAPHERMSETQS